MVANNQIFIGGFGGTGSRLLSQIFEAFGLYVGKEMSPRDAYRRGRTYDFGGNDFVTLFNTGFKYKDYTFLFNYIDKNLKDPNNFAIKHGHFMFMMDEIKTQYPGSKNVYIMRNPIDAALKLEYTPHYFYGKIPENDLEGKIQYYIDESIKACEKADLVVKYEDLCYNTDTELKKIRKFIGNSDLDLPQIDVKIPSSIGSGSDLYNKYDLTKLGY